MSELAKGDVVHLKSGGPAMTIDDIGQYGYDDSTRAKCVWFDGKTRKEELFALHTLKKSEADS
ncbi:YodC family protein [Pandoraea soli]